jgi:hypothetical protein
MKSHSAITLSNAIRHSAVGKTWCSSRKLSLPIISVKCIHQVSVQQIHWTYPPVVELYPMNLHDTRMCVIYRPIMTYPSTKTIILQGCSKHPRYKGVTSDNLLVLNVGNGWEWGLLRKLLIVSQWIIPEKSLRLAPVRIIVSVNTPTMIILIPSSYLEISTKLQ